MKVARIELVSERFAMTATRYGIDFDNLQKAHDEYKRIAGLLLARHEKKNDLPVFVEINGDAGQKLTVPIDNLTSVGLIDFSLVNESEKGVVDTYPLVFKRS